VTVQQSFDRAGPTIYPTGTTTVRLDHGLRLSWTNRQTGWFKYKMPHLERSQLKERGAREPPQTQERLALQPGSTNPILTSCTTRDLTPCATQPPPQHLTPASRCVGFLPILGPGAGRGSRVANPPWKRPAVSCPGVHVPCFQRTAHEIWLARQLTSCDPTPAQCPAHIPFTCEENKIRYPPHNGISWWLLFMVCGQFKLLGEKHRGTWQQLNHGSVWTVWQSIISLNYIANRGGLQQHTKESRNATTRKLYLVKHEFLAHKSATLII
jgi:hypothetical protein